MNIDSEIERILKEKGVAPPTISEDEFRRRLYEKLEVLIPRKVAEAIVRAHSEVVGEELERLGRVNPCKFLRPQKCIKGLDTSCLECINYVPKRRWPTNQFLRYFPPICGILFSFGGGYLAFWHFTPITPVSLFVLGIWILILGLWIWDLSGPFYMSAYHLGAIDERLGHRKHGWGKNG
jgi:hypothetical protein